MNAFQIMMKATQPSEKKTKNGYSIIRGSDKTEEELCYLLQFDGLSQPNPGISTGGAVMFKPISRKVIFERGEFINYATNNNGYFCELMPEYQFFIIFFQVKLYQQPWDNNEH